MTMNIRPVPDNPADEEPSSIATPEGDNEIAPDQPLEPAADIAVEGLRNPRGAEPNDDYKKDHD